MANLIAFNDGVIVEVAGGSDRGEPVSNRMAEAIDKGFNDAMDNLQQMLRKMAAAAKKGMQENGLSELSMELGVMFSAEGSLIVSKATAQASLKITAKISLDKEK